MNGLSVALLIAKATKYTMVRLPLIFIGISLIAPCIVARLISGPQDITSILRLENSLQPLIDEYVTQELDRLSTLRVKVDVYNAANDAIAVSSVNPSPNPFMAFQLMNRLRSQLNEIEGLMSGGRGDVFAESTNTYRTAHYLSVPNDEFVGIMALTIFMLQDVYQITAEHIAEGHIEGVAGKWVYGERECYALALQAYSVKRYDLVIGWATECRRRMSDGNNVDKAKLMQINAESLIQTMNYGRGVMALDELAVVDGGYRGYAVEGRETMIKEMQRLNMSMEDIPPLNVQRITSHLDGWTLRALGNYERLCRLGSFEPAYISPAHMCYYKQDHPYLRLAPIKVEVVHTHPLAVIFRQVVSEEEGEELIDIATKLLRPAKIFHVFDNGTVGERATPEIRVAKNCWLGPEHRLVHRIDARSQLMTNLDMSTAELLQMGNYGLGGQYRPHYDMSLDHEVNVFKDMGGLRNRIATVLFYPDAGGATVFPYLGVASFPSRGDALFWHNIHRNGSADLRTLHAGCGVLSGQKWVANKWLHEKRQEFVRRCPLHEGEDTEEETALGFDRTDQSAYCSRFKC